MAKTRSNRKSNRKSLIKRITKKTNKALPVVNKGLITIGNTAKNIAETSIPVIEKGVSTVYGTMATGFDLGVKGANTVKGMTMTNKKHSRRHHTGGRKTRRQRNH